MNQQCKVCGEPAAGFHFGAFTCEGCKVRKMNQNIARSYDLAIKRFCSIAEINKWFLLFQFKKIYVFEILSQEKGVKGFYFLLYTKTLLQSRYNLTIARYFFFNNRKIILHC